MLALRAAVPQAGWELGRAGSGECFSGQEWSLAAGPAWSSSSEQHPRALLPLQGGPVADTLSSPSQNEQRVYSPRRDGSRKSCFYICIWAQILSTHKASDTLPALTPSIHVLPWKLSLRPMNFLLLDSSDFVASSKRIPSRSQTMRQSHAAYAPAIAEKQRSLTWGPGASQSLDPWHTSQGTMICSALPCFLMMLWLGSCLQNQDSESTVPSPAPFLASPQPSGTKQRLLAYLLSRRVHTRCLA